MGAYQTLLTIAVEHSFFANGVCSCLDFQPTENTRRIFNNAGLIPKKTIDGIQLLYDENRVEALQLYAEDEQEPLCFEFKVYSTDPEFRSYSEPFADMADGILYFDNRATKSVKGKRNLSASKYVSNKDVKKPDANELESVITQRDRLLPPVFVLKIYASANPRPLLKQWLKSDLTRYSIAFNARQTYWKYYVLGQMAKQGLSISDPDNQVEFEPLGETSLSDQRVAFAFRTKRSIPLNERYDFRFQLKEEGLGGEKVLINRLPVACLTQTGKEMLAEQGMLVSEIYINS